MLELNSCISLSDKDYRLEKLLGKDKGGYSYLASCGGKFLFLSRFTTSRAATISLATR